MPPSEDAQEKWRRALAILRARLGEDTYSAWFSSIQLEDVRETRVYCSVPTNFLKRWIEDHHLENLLECVRLNLPDAERVAILLRIAGQVTHIPGDPKEEESVTEEPGESGEDSSTVKEEEGQSGSTSSTEEGGEGAKEAESTKPEGGGKIGLEMIIRHACYRFKLKREVMMKDHARKIARPRMISMFLSRHMTERSLPEIGRRFGGRDHTTVLHSVKKIERLIAEDIEFAFEVASLEATIRDITLLA